MSKLNHLYNAGKILFVDERIRIGGIMYVLRVCPSIQWSGLLYYLESCEKRAEGRCKHVSE